MYKISNISIRNKLILMQVFTSILVLAIIFTAFIITDITNYKEQKAENMISLAKVIGVNSIPMLQFQDQEAAQELLKGLHNGAPDIIHAAIAEENGKVFASYDRAGSGTFQPPSLLKGKNSLYQGNLLYVKNEIKDSATVLGKLYLEVELIELAEMKRTKYEIAGILTLIALGIAFFIALIVQTYISKRLLSLVKTMQEVGTTGDYSRQIVAEGKDEIGLLINGFNNLMQRVQENQQKKDEFIGIASHELKTPLTSVKGYVELLNNTSLQPNQKLFAQKTLDNVNKLERLIKDLLDVSKIQSGQLALNKKEFSIEQLLEETITAFQLISKTHEIIREDNTGNAHIVADRQRIEQVLLNLLSNAVKYSPGETKVIVKSQLTNSELLIKVRDFGIGIPKNEQANIFERFYRTRNLSQHISGFGLGLYISKDIISRHNGKIWVEAETKGSSFYFSLPLENAALLNNEPQTINHVNENYSR